MRQEENRPQQWAEKIWMELGKDLPAIMVLETYLHDFEVETIRLHSESVASPVPTPRKIRLLKTVRGDWPIGDMYSAGPGEYEADVNPHGAVSVRHADGSLLA